MPGLTVDDVKGVVMVGGATRMPQVQRAVGEFFRRDPLNNLDPDKVVALGAAMQANVLAGNKPAGRGLAASRRDSALARRRDDGRARREDHSAQHHHPRGQGRRSSPRSRTARAR
jgi:molecular chaperone DnaK (HSP70)